MSIGSLFTLAMFALAQPALPVVQVTSDDTVIARSCRIEIAPGAVIEDKNNDGVIHIAAPDITVEFADGSVLRGSAKGKRPDEYRGCGIRLNGHANVSLRKVRVSGYWCGLYATRADNLALEKIDASDNRRAFLRSMPAAEDSSDWLFPHNNDENQWLKNYAAAIYVEDSKSLSVRDCRVRHGQNALCLDRVTDSRIHDSDFSFNSGWGIAMWRCERNVISRNAIDFCVRGYSHGVYNRGQDSAGILMFEQNNANVIAENSATHGGDCFFGFAGREALGEAGSHDADWYKRRGNNDNILIGNDFSYSPAHGIEMTFSFGNKFLNNRIVGNAICGVWGGYSQDTLIAGNTFEENGEMGYGLERGGVNVEHGRNNRIVQNTFKNNKCGVHLWGGPNPRFAERTWGKANGIDSTDNLISGNALAGDALAFHFRGPGKVSLAGNVLRDVAKTVVADPQHQIIERGAALGSESPPLYQVLGEKRPVGARAHLRGRQNIIMTEWGPWDHESPLVRLIQANGRQRVYQLHNVPSSGRDISLVGSGGIEKIVDGDTITLKAIHPGVHDYTLRIRAGDFQQEFRQTLLAMQWDATFFTWTKEVDPRENLEAWRKLASGPAAITTKLDHLVLKYAMGGPANLKISDKLKGFAGDYFGCVARTRLPLGKGKWLFKTLSDDGVRVLADGKPLIENWTWHVPATNTGVLDLAAAKEVEIIVEHFEIDGYAVLELQISP